MGACVPPAGGGSRDVMGATQGSEVAQKMALDQIRYSTVWEDADLLTQGLRIGPDDDVLCVASGGDNVFALLLEEPRSVTAIDMSPAQIALVELKLAAIRALEWAAFVALLGYADADRETLYRAVRAGMPESAVAFWDARVDVIADGLHRAGRLERYFEAFATEHLPRLWAPDLYARLCATPTLEAQAELFEREAFTSAFQAAFAEYYGRESMASRGRDPAQFAYVDGDDSGSFFLRRFHWVCTALPLRGNFYVERFLTGTHADLGAGPAYLRPGNFARLKALVDRVTVVQAALEAHLGEVAPGTYSHAALSDIFEYMSDDAGDALFGALARAVRAGGRIAYWNLLVPRRPGPSLGDRLRALPDGNALWERDRSWFYRAFRAEEIV